MSKEPSLAFTLPFCLHLNLFSCQRGVKHTEKGQRMAWESVELFIQALNKILLRWASPAVYKALKGKSRPAELKTVLLSPWQGDNPQDIRNSTSNF